MILKSRFQLTRLEVDSLSNGSICVMYVLKGTETDRLNGTCQTMIAVLTIEGYLASFFHFYWSILSFCSQLQNIFFDIPSHFGQLTLIPVYSNIIIVIRVMTNSNSYDCSYHEKPLLECIMDILRFMDGWKRKIPDQNIKVIQWKGQLLFRSP